ncbi:MAG: hypothetical protein OEZ51_13985 [Nitrospinota bacterium]|nr:hypothetical protein [Nitrospinota bacterium]
MKKLKVVKTAGSKSDQRLFRCPVVVIPLAGREVIKRGCGRLGMTEFDAGRRCLYCGNYIYRKTASVESMWFHFRWAREYWRTHNTQGRDFVNGVPVSGRAESLPSSCLSDLSESRPPRWFPYFLSHSDREFHEYLLNLKAS